MISKFLIAFILFAITITGCKTQKEKQSVPAKENHSDQSKKNKTSSTTENPINSTSIEQSLNFDRLKTMEFVSAKENDSIFATLIKTPCFGTCPVYKLMIFKSGVALYEGIQHVEKKGRYLVSFSEEEMKKIEIKAIEINYFNLQDEYDSPVTDFPTTHTSLRLNGKAKNVSNRVGGPKGLKELENYIHETLMQKDFKEIPK